MYNQMDKKWVELQLGDDIKCSVEVRCIPGTPQDVLQRLALAVLQDSIPKKKTGLSSLGESLQRISDYEFSQGRGRAYEAHQESSRNLKEALAEMGIKVDGLDFM